MWEDVALVVAETQNDCNWSFIAAELWSLKVGFGDVGYLRRKGIWGRAYRMGG